MRELSVQICFTRPSLGNGQSGRARDGRRFFARSLSGRVLFLATWHQANMAFAAQALGRHQDAVAKVHWDVEVDGVVRRDGWYRRYYRSAGGKPRYCLHEAFLAGQTVTLNCVVPAAIPDDDFRRLLELAGTYRGLSPYRPAEYGLYRVEQIQPRREYPTGPADAGDRDDTPRDTHHDQEGRDDPA
jgi:hypothetical protein